MSNTVLDNSRISKHLGQISEYKSTYDAGLLVREPRQNNREHLYINESTGLPFVGFDTWNAYEVSGLTNKGRPVAGVAKIVYPCESEYIVESKSIKLYFNSFNMHNCGDTSDDVYQYISDTAEQDLSELLETDVRVNVVPAHVANDAEAYDVFEGKKFTTLEDVCSPNLVFDTYQETPGLLNNEAEGFHTYNIDVHSSLLKSNCRVTSQPDWGDVYISMTGVNTRAKPNNNDLLKYIVSFRDECHFHEEICETIFIRLLDKYKPDGLCVTCLYARRGGIDINPSRATHEHLLPLNLFDINVLHKKTAKQ